jgi:hypothetical protein
VPWWNYSFGFACRYSKKNRKEKKGKKEEI